MNDKLDELHYIYKMIGNYGFCTVQELLDKYNALQEQIDKAIEYITKEYYKEHDRSLENLCLRNCTYEPSLVVLSILKGEENEC